MQTLIIEVRGGLAQEVYSDAKNLRVVLVDWDAGESPGDRCFCGNFSCNQCQSFRTTHATQSKN